MRVRTAVLAGALAAAFAPAAAMAGGFLKLSGVAVPPVATTDPGWMEVVSYSYSPAPPSSPNGAGAGKAAGKMTITRIQDAVSPTLMQDYSANHDFATAILDVAAADGSTMSYELSNAVITAYQANGGGGASQETLTLTFQKVETIDKTATPIVDGVAVRLPVLSGGNALAHAATLPPASSPSNTTRPSAASPNPRR